MFEQLFEGFRKASESSILAQQEMLKQWAEKWPTASLSAASSVMERSSAFQKRWVESAVETWERHRALLDSSVKACLQLIQESARMSDAKSPDESRRRLEEFWRKSIDMMKAQSDAQFAELKKASENIFEVARNSMQATPDAA